MLQGVNTGIFNLLVPKAHNSECQNLPFAELGTFGILEFLQ